MSYLTPGTIAGLRSANQGIYPNDSVPATNQDPVQIGDGASAGTDAVVVGQNSTASGTGALTVGSSSSANGSRSVSVGTSTTAGGTAVIVIGDASSAYGTSDIAIGDGAGSGSVAVGGDNIAIGRAALDGLTAVGANNVAIGAEAGTEVTSGSGNVIIGHDAGILIDAGANNVVIGDAAGPLMEDASSNVVIGDAADVGVSNAGAIAIGTGATAIGDSSVAIGENIANNVDDTVAFGSGGTTFMRLGAIGTVTQTTNVNTSVTLNAHQGIITMFTFISDGNSASFTVSNTRCKATSCVIATLENANAYSKVSVHNIADNSFRISLDNHSGSDEGAPSKIHFCIFGPQ